VRLKDFQRIYLMMHKFIAGWRCCNRGRQALMSDTEASPKYSPDCGFVTA
jgi:hypothetical protein